MDKLSFRWGRRLKQKLARSLIILYLGMVSASAVSAQNVVPDNTAHPVCQTNSGIPGVIFQGHSGTLVAPRNFGAIALDDVNEATENASVGNGQVEIFSSIRFGQEILIFSYPNADIERQTTVYFVDGFGRTKSACELSIRRFDPEQHDLAATSRGYCQFGQRTGISTITIGTNEVFDFPERYVEGMTSRPSVMNYNPEPGGRAVRLYALSEGHAIFAWMGEDTGNGILKGLCPFIVSDGS